MLRTTRGLLTKQSSKNSTGASRFGSPHSVRRGTGEYKSYPGRPGIGRATKAPRVPIDPERLETHIMLILPRGGPCLAILFGTRPASATSLNLEMRGSSHAHVPCTITPSRIESTDISTPRKYQDSALGGKRVSPHRRFIGDARLGVIRRMSHSCKSPHMCLVKRKRLSRKSHASAETKWISPVCVLVQKLRH